jgi:hypothetical protein
VRRALYAYLNPLFGEISEQGDQSGWPFGRPVTEGELHGVVQSIDGVELIHSLRIYEADPRTSERAATPLTGRLTIKPEELIMSVNHQVKADRAVRL